MLIIRTRREGMARHDAIKCNKKDHKIELNHLRIVVDTQSQSFHLVMD